MADIRCPMCGKNNSTGLVNCQFCGARLVPVTGNAPQINANPAPDAAPAAKTPDAPPAATTPQDNTADWLNSLRDNTTESPEENGGGAQAPEKEGQEDNDWLARLSVDKDQAVPGATSQPADTGFFPEDIGVGFQQRGSTPVNGKSGEGWIHQQEDWSPDGSSMEVEIPIPEAASTPPSEKPAEEDDTADWLKQFGDFSYTPEIPGESSPEELSEGTQKAADWAGVGEDVPSTWLKQFEVSHPLAVNPEAGPEADHIAEALVPEATGDDNLSRTSENNLPEIEGLSPIIGDLSLAGADLSPAGGDLSPGVGDETQTNGGEQLPAWLNQASSDEKSQADEAEIPPWLVEFNAEKSFAEPASGDETPAWLAELPGEHPAEISQPVEKTAGTPEATTEIPDWLKEFEKEGVKEGEISPAPFELGQEETFPQKIKPADETAQAPTDEAPQPGTEEALPGPSEPDLPDWLGGYTNGSPVDAAAQRPEESVPTIANTPPAERGSQAQAADPFAGEDLPDWLSEFGQPTEKEDEGVPAEIPAPGTPPQGGTAGVSPFAVTELPEWLAGVGGETEPQGETQDSGQLAPSTPFSETQVPAAPDSGAQPFAGVDIPDWLADFDQQETAPIEETAPAPPAPDEKSVQAVVEEDPKIATALPVTAGELPDWLGEYKSAPAGSEEQPEQPAAEESAVPPAGNAAAANLPGWLESMRPVEAVLPGSVQAQETGRVEKTGPLAGLQSLLPGEQIVFQYQRPDMPSSKLHVTERQRLHADILDGLLAETTRPKPAAQPKSPAGQIFLRVLVSLALLVAVIVPVVLTPFNTPVAPSGARPAVQQLYNQLNSLPANAPVLVAADFDPGFYGEMRLVSSPVLRHLILRNSRLAFVSTNPAGPLLAESLLRDASADLDKSQPGWGSYDTAQKTVNLGYLPGSLTSLQELVADPQVATRYGLRIPLDKRLAWSYPALVGANSLADFGAVIVLVDNIDNGRAWLEQVQPTLGRVPLLLVSSAQAGPLLEPYTQSQQARGLLAGLGDAVAYEQISGLQASHSGEWGAYQLSLVVAILIILVGSVFQAASTLRSKPKSQKGG